MSDSLAKMEKAHQWLAEAKTLDDLAQIRDYAKAAEAYARAAKLGRAHENDAIEIRMLAERRAGEMLREMDLPGRGGGDTKSSSAKELDSLSDIGIDKKESFTWQKLAALPEPEFKRAVENV